MWGIQIPNDCTLVLRSTNLYNTIQYYTVINVHFRNENDLVSLKPILFCNAPAENGARFGLLPHNEDFWRKERQKGRGGGEGTEREENKRALCSQKQIYYWLIGSDTYPLSCHGDITAPMMTPPTSSYYCRRESLSSRKREEASCEEQQQGL